MKKKIVLLPRMWESHSIPLLGDRPQGIINKTVLKDSDILIVVFWTRLGTPTSKALSGSVEEIEEHLSLNKPILLYFSSAKIEPTKIDNKQYSKLLEFKESIKKKCLYYEYKDYDDFKSSLLRNLIHLIQTHNYFSDIDQDFSNNDIHISKDNVEKLLISELTDKAKFLLKEASLSNGEIARLEYIGGIHFEVNGKSYKFNNKRDESLFEEGLEILELNNLVIPTSYKRVVFKLSAAGYRIADLLPD